VRFYKALRGCEDEQAQARLADQEPALYRAWQLHGQASLPRWEVEARLLANEGHDTIARKCELTPTVVTTYHDIFFAVRNRLHARDWVMTCVVGPKAHRGQLTEEDQDVFLKLYGYNGGPRVVDALSALFQRFLFVATLAGAAGPGLEGRGAAARLDPHGPAGAPDPCRRF
jgi:hypothetical protein